MNTPKYTRRDFLKLAGLSLGALAFRPFLGWGEDLEDADLVRIATTSISVYSQPWDESQIRFQRYRDDLVHVYEEVVSEHGPSWNPVWYRVWGGYIHSAYTQRVKTRLNPILDTFSDGPRVAEVTVPYTQALRNRAALGWEPIYRLYYGSMHWVTALEKGPDGLPWYRLKDELLKIDYHVPAAYLRLLDDEEFAPISPEINPSQKWIHVSLARQTLTAYQEDRVILETKVSTGIPRKNLPPGAIPTDTPTGQFHVEIKLPSKHMGDGRITSDPEAYELPGVPWVCFFEPNTGVALHGTYWHTNYGLQMSHGCVNLKNEDARFLYRWTTPVAEASSRSTNGYGTLVIVE
ncbi:MAG TPA: L,D-transpeptidase [Anaerolineaceae bacterium]|jgi:lipoprotein-anchoring transpeptidase ErfK/SrfK|nr:L,D-transpeptidase [Anaerolineaceae bacterium]